MASDRIQRQIDRFLDEAEEAVTQGDWSVAEDRARKVLALDPQNSDALTYVAAADRALNDSFPPTTGEPATATPPVTTDATSRQCPL